MNLIDAAAKELLDDAREIANDNPEFRQVDYAGFERVMWPDDFTMEQHGLTRPEFTAAVLMAWQGFKHDRFMP